MFGGGRVSACGVPDMSTPLAVHRTMKGDPTVDVTWGGRPSLQAWAPTAASCWCQDELPKDPDGCPWVTVQPCSEASALWGRRRRVWPHSPVLRHPGLRGACSPEPTIPERGSVVRNWLRILSLLLMWSQCPQYRPLGGSLELIVCFVL